MGPLALVAALLWLVSLAGCAHSLAYRLTGQPGVYTLTNLHPDEIRARLYTMNYQQAGLIPVCTPVRIERVATKEMIFVRLDTGKRYNYVVHPSMQGAFQQNLDKYFGSECPKQLLGQLAGVDAQGVEEGRVLPGMSKGAVVLAIGYPPEHATPSLEADTWHYWKNRWDSFLVYFANGRVTHIQD